MHNHSWFGIVVDDSSKGFMDRPTSEHLRVLIIYSGVHCLSCSDSYREAD